MLEIKIRDLVTEPRRQAVLQKNEANWNIICSALDVIGDTELALDAYDNWAPPNDKGKRYIIYYGVLQAMSTQQDALQQLRRVLGIFVKLPTDMRNIRNARAASVGHPIGRAEDGKVKSYFIARHSFSKDGFTLMAISDDSTVSTDQVDISDMIIKQREFVEHSMEDIVKMLNGDELAHRVRYRNCQLVNIFPSSLSYSLEKLREAARKYGTSDVDIALASGHLQAVREAIDRFQSSLTERGDWDGCVSAQREMGLARHALGRLFDFFQDLSRGAFEDADAYIFATFLESRLREARRIAEEFDKKYATDP